jgi:hypothetical protein
VNCHGDPVPMELSSSHIKVHSAVLMPICPRGLDYLRLYFLVPAWSLTHRWLARVCRIEGRNVLTCHTNSFSFFSVSQVRQ